jgi:DNA repair exonuclease SbcCD ATPase subunit
MAGTNAYGPIFRELESLENACRAAQEFLPDVQSVLAPLAALIAELKALKSRQENLEGERQQTTQMIRQRLDEAKEQARRVRGFVKARLGTKNERLNQFGAAPIRKRGSRKPQPEVEPPTEPQTE